MNQKSNSMMAKSLMFAVMSLSLVACGVKTAYVSEKVSTGCIDGIVYFQNVAYRVNDKPFYYPTAAKIDKVTLQPIKCDN